MLLKRRAIIEKSIYERIEGVVECMSCKYITRIGEVGGYCSKLKLRFVSTNIDKCCLCGTELINKFCKSKTISFNLKYSYKPL